MIAFGCSITDARAYERHAEPGIRLAAEQDSEVLVFRDEGLQNCQLVRVTFGGEEGDNFRRGIRSNGNRRS